VRKFEAHLYRFIAANYPGLVQEIESKDGLDEGLKSRLNEVVSVAKREFSA
jgi:F0F1-type ATP synthase alpha subunit